MCRDFWNSKARVGAMVEAVSFSTLGLISSGPLAMCGFSLSCSVLAHSLLISIFCMVSFLMLVDGAHIEAENTDWNCLFSAPALPNGSVMSRYLIRSVSTSGFSDARHLISLYS